MKYASLHLPVCFSTSGVPHDIVLVLSQQTTWVIGALDLEVTLKLAFFDIFGGSYL